MNKEVMTRTMEKLGQALYYRARKANEADKAGRAVKYLERVGFLKRQN